MAVEMNDLSMLQPLSIKDAIWLEHALHLKRMDKVKSDDAKLKFALDRLEELELYMLDIREISRNTNVYVKLAALKGGKRPPKIRPIKTDELPSEIVSKRKRKEGVLNQEHVKSKEELQKEEDDLVRRCIEFENKQREKEQKRAAMAKVGGESTNGVKHDAPGKP